MFFHACIQCCLFVIQFLVWTSMVSGFFRLIRSECRRNLMAVLVKLSSYKEICKSKTFTQGNKLLIPKNNDFESWHKYIIHQWFSSWMGWDRKNWSFLIRSYVCSIRLMKCVLVPLCFWKKKFPVYVEYVVWKEDYEC